MANCVDYFATLSRTPGPLVCKKIEEDVGSGEFNLHPKDLWEDAVTDITLIYEGEECPAGEGWVVVDESVEGMKLPFPQLVYRRRKDSGKLDHIVEIRVIPPGVDIPRDFELVLTSVSEAYTAYLFPTGYVAVRRARKSAMAYVKGDRIIDDVATIWLQEGESVPERYEKAAVARTETAMSSMAQQMGMRPTNAASETFGLVYHTRAPVGLTDLRYNSATLERYPQQDNKTFPLPHNELPLFAFPHGLRLEFESSNRYPLPHFFTFVFTDADGKHMYAACLHFYEKLSGAEVQDVFESIFGDDKVMSMVSGTNIFCPKVICVVSSRPYYRAMRRYLRQLYSLSLSSMPLPLEYFVACLVAQVPTPMEGGRPFHVLLDSALISPTSRALKPIKFVLPDRKSFPHMDIDFAAPLRCLSVELVLAVFVLLLREAKVAFMCTSGTLLTEVMETLRSLLFPLTWSSTFVSRLPNALSGLLQAPGGFMVGLHVEEKGPRIQKETFSSPLNLGSPKTPQKSLPEEVHAWTGSMTVGTYVVDLNECAIFQFRGNAKPEQIEQKDVQALIDSVPTLPRRRLQHFLDSVARDFSMGPSTVGLEQFDSAFDMKPQVTAEENRSTRWDSFPTLEVRDSFLVFMVDVLGFYQDFIIPPPETLGKSVFRTFQEQFDVSEYLQALTDVKKRPFLESLTETQMFSFLLQQRAEGSSQVLAYAEDMAKLLRDFGLHLLGPNAATAAGMDGVLSGRNPSPAQLELPRPMFQLLAAYKRMECLPRDQLLSYQSTDSAISPPQKRSSIFDSISPTLRRNPVAPQQLDLRKASIKDLLNLSACIKMNSEIVEVQAILEGVDSNDADAYISRRGELDRHDEEENLRLGNDKLGPLIIPGPLFPDGQAGGHDIDNQEPSKRYSYETWPTFDPLLLEEGKACVHKTVRTIRTVRAFAIEKVRRTLILLRRENSARLSFCFTGALCSFPHRQPATEQGFGSESNAVVSTILDIYQSSLTRLSVRTYHKVQPISDLFQMLGVIAQIEHVGLVDYIDERIWRAALIVCANAGGDLARRVSFALYGAIDVFRQGGNCLSAGQYMRSLQTFKRAKGYDDDTTKGMLDPCMFIEEMGYTWFVQRTAMAARGKIQDGQLAVGEAERQRTSSTSSTSDGTKRSIFESIASGFEERRSNNQFNSSLGNTDIEALQLLLRRPTESVESVSSQLALVSGGLGFGLFCCARPSESHWCYTPLNATRLTKYHTEKSVKDSAISTLNGLTERLKGLHREAKQRSTSVTSPSPLETRPDSPGTPIQSPTSSWRARARSIFGGSFNSDTSSPTLFGADATTAEAESDAEAIGTETEKLSANYTRSAKIHAKALENGSFTDDENSEEEEDASEDDTDSAVNSVDSAALTYRTSHSREDRQSASLMSLVDKTAECSIESNKEDEEGDNKASDDGGVVACSVVESEVSTEGDGADTAEVEHIAITAADLQNSLNDLHNKEFMHRKRILGIYCRTPCPKCSVSLLEEEVLSAWNGLKANKVNANESSRDILAAHRVVCPGCKMEATPLLHIVCCQDSDDGVSTIWQYETPHLSPGGLQYLHEEILERVGRRVGEEYYLYKASPVVYWNIQWYCSRVGTPTGFITVGDEIDANLTSENMESKVHSPHQGPVIVGWSEHSVYARIRKMFSTSGSSSELSMVDVYPKCTPDEIEILNRACSCIDGTNPGIKSALFAISEVTSLFAQQSENDVANARTLYETLITIAHVGKSEFLGNALERKDADFVVQLSKPSALDMNIYEAIKCVMVSSDFNQMHTTEEAFVARMPGRGDMGFRTALGLLI
eukprot:GSChrysophyteH1.ASY1.ANO1.474.1 assembled CDS